jgi:hypothetical protein
MGPTGCPETLVRNYHYSLRNNPEEHSSQAESLGAKAVAGGVVPAPADCEGDRTFVV